MTKFRLKLGDCLEVMKDISDNSFHSVVTDPPYGLSFMGKNWDHGIPGKIFWEEILRVSKPGAYLLAFGGTRTFHRLTVAIEDAGWEMRDCLMWLYGSGFPKSMDISKAIDKAAGAEREVIGIGKGTGKQNPAWNGTAAGRKENSLKPEYDLTTPATDAARQWDGWGTALKPAWEPIIMARKPLAEKTVAANVLAHGCGGINVDGCRIAHNEECKPMSAQLGGNKVYGQSGRYDPTTELKPNGRWPANLILECTCDEVFVTGEKGEIYSYSGREYSNKETSMFNGDKPQSPSNYNDRNLIVTHTNPECPCALLNSQKNETSRFFYCSKSSKSDRGEENNHPTVKPTDLMRYLCRLITPPNGIVFDPFLGSGTTLKAAILEGFRGYGIEKEKDYFEIAQRRIEEAHGK